MLVPKKSSAKAVKTYKIKNKIVTNKNLNKNMIHFGIFFIKLLKNSVLLIKLELLFASSDSSNLRVNNSFKGTDAVLKTNIVKGAPNIQKIAN
jgi:hypothetical protein